MNKMETDQVSQIHDRNSGRRARMLRTGIGSEVDQELLQIEATQELTAMSNREQLAILNSQAKRIVEATRTQKDETVQTFVRLAGSLAEPLGPDTVTSQFGAVPYVRFNPDTNYIGGQQ